MDSTRSKQSPLPNTAPAPWGPLDGHAFRGLAGEIVKHIEPHTEADAAGILLQLLVMYGNAIGRTAHFCVDGTRHNLNLYLALVGLTAGGRKGTSWNHAFNVMKAADPDWARDCVTSGLTTGEGLSWKLRDGDTLHDTQEGDEGQDKRPRAEHDGADKRLLAYEPELANLLGIVAGGRNSLGPTLRTAWDGGVLQTLTKADAARATGAHVSIIGHITRDELREIVTPRILNNGCVNRFVWAAVQRSKLLPHGGNLLTAALQPLYARLASAIDFARQTAEMRRDAGGNKAWEEKLRNADPGG